MPASLSNAFTISSWSLVFWLLVGMVLAGILSLLVGLLRKGDVRSPREELIAVEEIAIRRADQLEAIEGIGPEIATLLRAKGIHRFDQLGAMSAFAIQQLLLGNPSFELARPLSWPLQARLLMHNRLAEFARVASAFKAGVVPTAIISGIGESLEARLAEIHVSSVETLAAASTPDLERRLAETGESVSASRIEGWINEAKSLLSGGPERVLAFTGLPAAALTPFVGETLISETVIVERRVAGGTARKGSGGIAPRVLEWLPLGLGALGILLLLLLCILRIWCPYGCIPPKPLECVEPKMCRLPCPTPTNDVHVFRLNATFFTNRPDLRYPDTTKADMIAKIFNRDLQKHQDAPESIVVVGHADIRPTTRKGGNQKLSEDRAKTIEAMIKQELADELSKDPSNKAYTALASKSIVAVGASDRVADASADTLNRCKPLKGDRGKYDDCLLADRRVDVTIIYPDKTAAP